MLRSPMGLLGPVFLVLAVPTASAQDAAATVPASPNAAATPASTDTALGEDPDHEDAFGADAADARAEGRSLEPEAPPRTRHEDPTVEYHSIGVSYRHAFVPQGVVELFVGDAPAGLRVPQVALEYAKRADGFELMATLSYQDYGFTGGFRQDGDDRFEYEWLDSNLKSIGLGMSVGWSSSFSDVFAIEGGLELGLGGLLGRVRRTEAYPSLGTSADGRGGFAPCAGPTTAGGAGSDAPTGDFDPTRYGDAANAVTAYCGVPDNGQLSDPDVRNGEQYGVNYRNWANGGSLPVISWRLAPRLSFRFKVAPQFLLRVDTGFDFGSGAFVGLGAHYIL